MINILQKTDKNSTDIRLIQDIVRELQRSQGARANTSTQSTVDLSPVNARVIIPLTIYSLKNWSKATPPLSACARI
jgi:hypothetical protein